MKVKLKSIIFWDMTPCSATQPTTRRHIPEDDTLHNHRRENLKAYEGKVVPPL
jgi:hypothetical protein